MTKTTNFNNQNILEISCKCPSCYPKLYTWNWFRWINIGLLDIASCEPFELLLLFFPNDPIWTDLSFQPSSSPPLRPSGPVEVEAGRRKLSLLFKLSGLFQEYFCEDFLTATVPVLLVIHAFRAKEILAACLPATPITPLSPPSSATIPSVPFHAWLCAATPASEGPVFRLHLHSQKSPHG